MEIMITALIDMFPKILRPRKQALTLTLCVVFCLLGFTCVTRVSGYKVLRYIPYGLHSEDYGIFCNSSGTKTQKVM